LGTPAPYFFGVFWGVVDWAQNDRLKPNQITS
jgi:hypothetical protein